MPPREGLSRRDRSLVTLAILIALRATDEEIAEV
jgi:alkylhydroperoxidase/carboxymuconolactone decarboxylase family protein YurZ